MSDRLLSDMFGAEPPAEEEPTEVDDGADADLEEVEGLSDSDVLDELEGLLSTLPEER